MKFQILSIILLSLFCWSCHQNVDLPKPQNSLVTNSNYSITGCQIQFLQFDLNTQMYSFNGNDWIEFDQAFTASADFFPAARIVMETETMIFCDFVDLDIDEYTYSVEQLTNPQRSRYTVLLSEDTLVPLVNGVGVAGKFERSRRYETASNVIEVQ